MADEAQENVTDMKMKEENAPEKIRKSTRVF